ncbi:MAG TPA: UDP-N-acetylmuramate dehydrogenase [Chitinophagaceae bacterium]|nr:UDP-N-acetylmuramate dehydrogenase [Chitinophagaceae bacterium]
MQIHENFSLKPYNTFGIEAKARIFASFFSVEDLEEYIMMFSQHPILILGGGSNILLTKDYEGVVLKNEITGVDVQHEDEEHVYVKVGAGENWHQFVLHCIKHNWAGIENLSLIPGNVGASPIQNIGAYGVELDDVFWSLEAYHISERRIHTFTRTDCEFGYRDSIFKNRYKGEFVILSVTLQLRKKPIFHTSYGAITEELEKMKVKDLSIQAISQAVINIRSSKLPDPKLIPNAGSFFKNPEVPVTQYEELKKEFPDIVAYPLTKLTVKLAAGWMIEQCGPDKIGTSWKGYRKNDAGCHARQALVLVNYGNAKGSEIYDLSEQILKSVSKKFKVSLEREVNII